ncbi:helix-turn-helix domain-containing protein [Phreatobacter sp.]|uniref:AraC family transcriptional regulator n=1 Tax=Phreatobacter sp. TaxID=1966341 RepID=UPI003F717200
MLTWSTDSLPPHRRFDFWREERGRQLFGVTIELPPEHRPAFHGRFSATEVGGATLASLNASAYQVSRTEADIARVPNDSLIIGLQVAGPGWCDTLAGQAFVDVGAVMIGHANLPSQATPATTGDFHAHMLRIPLGRIGEGREAAGRLHFAPAQDDRLSMLVDAAASALIEEAPSLAPEVAEGSVAVIARLALLARGAVPAGSRESRQALRAGHHLAAVRIMRRNLHRAGLAPEAVATALGISLRQLHIVFEPTGRSFQTTLTGMRIDMACRRLAARPAESIADLAFACGFESLPTFYRAFRRFAGRTPREVRAGQA